MTLDGATERSPWVSLERGPTQNAAYVVGGTFVVVWVVGAIMRAFKGLPFDAALFKFIGISAVIVGGFTALATAYLKSWRLKYNSTEIVDSYSLGRLKKSTSYPVSTLSNVTCYHRDPTMLGIPFDTLVFDFGKSKLMLQMGNWTRESLKQFVRDLIHYRSDVPVDERVLNFVAGEYDGMFSDASDAQRSTGYADPVDF